MLYRRKTKQIKAIKFELNNLEKIKQFCGGLDMDQERRYMLAFSKNQDVVLHEGDYIIKHENDVFEVMEENKFNELYAHEYNTSMVSDDELFE